MEAYKQLEKAQKAGLIRSLGVSNYAVEDFEELMASGATVVPAINQVKTPLHLDRPLPVPILPAPRPLTSRNAF